MGKHYSTPDIRERRTIPIRVNSSVVVGFILILLIHAGGRALSETENDQNLQIRLGERLFNDNRFSSRDGDLQSSCASCHMVNQDPQGRRAFTDFLARSWVPWRSSDPRRDGLRNAPTLLDTARMPQLHFDGEFESLEQLVKGTLLGRPLGWLPGEEEQATDQVYRVLLSDSDADPNAADSYRIQFRRAYGAAIEKLNRAEVLDLVAKAVGAYLKTLKTEKDSPYDRFARANKLAESLGEGESPAAFAEKVLAQVHSLETKGDLKLTSAFGVDALKGLKAFLSVRGERSAGNCVACHAPPLFTDFSFHNLGVSQIEYDGVHGEGSFVSLALPRAAHAIRPSPQFREIPMLKNPGHADLGYWNFAKLDSGLRRAGESDDQFLERMVATFKTPTLRDLAFSRPYMHNGAFSSLESALNEVMRLSMLARSGRLRAADDEMMKVRLSEADIPPLIAFLNSLNDSTPGPGERIRQK